MNFLLTFVVFISWFSPKPVSTRIFPKCEEYYRNRNEFGYLEKPDMTCEMVDTVANATTIFLFPTSRSWTEFKCSNCSLGMIPIGLFENNYQIEILSLARSGITQLSVKDFIKARNLRLLNVSHNNIETLESYLFVHAANLTVVDLSYNKIAVISDHTFLQNVKLQSILLNDNQLISFSTVLPPSVQSLFLQNNKLMSLTNIDTLNIVELDLSNNSQLQLYTIPVATIQKLPNIKLRVCTILAETSLSIDMTGNSVESVVVEGFSKAIIKELYLAQNNLTSVANLTELRFLEVLDLSMNPVVDIGLQTFGKMTELRTLRLEDCGLHHLPIGMFSQQTQLIELDISYNRMGQLDLSHLTLLESLTTLYIDGNNLFEIDITEAKHLSEQLSYIGLADNQFNCSFLISLSRIFANKIVIEPAKVQLNASNVFGMACQTTSENSQIATRSHIFTPAIRKAANHLEFYNEIETRLSNISNSIRQMVHEKSDSSLSQRGELLELRQNIASVRNDLEGRLLNMKSEIVLSVTDILNINDNQAHNGSALESTMEKLNQLNVERFKMLADRVERISNEMKGVQDKSPASQVQGHPEVVHEDTSSSNKWFVGCILLLFVNTGLVLLFVFGRLGFLHGRVSNLRRSTSLSTVMTAC